MQNNEQDERAPQSADAAPKSKNVKLFTGLGLVVLVIAGYAVLKYLPATPPKQQGQTNKNSSAKAVTVVANYSEQLTALKDTPNFSAIKQKYGLNLTAAQEKFLEQNHFLLIDPANTNLAPGTNFDDMLSEFDSIGGSSLASDRLPEDTKLVTPDVMLHAYHRFFEMTLEQLEQKELAQSLGDFLTSLHSNLLTAEQNSSGYTQQRYQNLLAEITVARVLFENKSPAKPDSFDDSDQENAYIQRDKTIDSYENAKAILTKYQTGLTPDLIGKIQTDLQSIYKASDVGVSPLFGQYSDTLKTDYTQFTPRSHYVKNSALRAYFRTMMYLGRSSYFLQNDVGIVDSNLLAKQFKVRSSAGITPLDPWQKIMSVTGFYAGQSDDLTYTEWNDFENKILNNAGSDADLISQSNIQKMADSLNKLRLPKILSDVVVDDNIGSQTKSDLLRKSLAFRIFGQRFTFDGWILNDLTSGDEQSVPKLPSTPSALFIPAVMGDQRALTDAQAFLKQSAGFSSQGVDSFMTKFNQKQSDIAKVTSSDWFGSMGSAWLYVLGSLTHSYGTGYPMYMQATPFADKQIQTFLGSYTELKHDTLLYAKQSYAERGGGGDDSPVPPVVKGFVEPNMDFWNRFNQLLSQTQDTFTKNNIFSDSAVMSRLQNFQDISTFYTGLAKQELENQPISEDDYEKLRTTGLSFMAQPFDSSADPDPDAGKVALIADIHTDAVKNQILYEADGKPYLMLAVVSNEQTPRVVASMVYNHYEFTGPLGGQRLTDQDWRDWVYNQPGKLPVKNFWYGPLIAK